MNLSDFLAQTCSSMLNEAISSRDIDRALDIIKKYLSKYKIYTYLNTRYELTIDNKPMIGIGCFTDKNEGAVFCWDWSAGSSAQCEYVCFFKNWDEAAVAWINGEVPVADVLLQGKGANTIQMVKVVQSVLTGKTPMTTKGVSEFIQDAQLYESVNDSVNEASDDPVVADLKRRKDNLYMKIRHWTRKGKDITGLQAEYDALTQEYNNARTRVSGNVPVAPRMNAEFEKVVAQFEEEERATPEERFDDMKSYIYNVIAGIRPLALLCGAPGVGKTFRVMQAVKGTGKEHNKDYKILKGTCTSSALYQTLHDFKEPGQLIIMDDCDNVFKDADSINLLKAAFDSSDERWVSWNTSRAPLMDEEMAHECDDAVFLNNKWYYPKEFLYEGGGIIITNYRAGQIDTAVRNRALICDLDFTTTEILSLIEGLAPKICPQLPMSAKEQALEYLREMADKGMPIELSIRSFTLCAGIYNTDADDRIKKRRINEQMKLQAMQGGKKY